MFSGAVYCFFTTIIFLNTAGQQAYIFNYDHLTKTIFHIKTNSFRGKVHLWLVALDISMENLENQHHKDNICQTQTDVVPITSRNYPTKIWRTNTEYKRLTNTGIIWHETETVYVTVLVNNKDN